MLRALRFPHAKILLLLALTAAACGPTRPEFDIDLAHGEIAKAFGRTTEAVAILGDSRGSAPDLWIVDFTVDGFDPFLQAQFQGDPTGWHLQSVRERPTGPEDKPFVGVGVMLGIFRSAVVQKAAETEQRMRDLAGLIERHAVDHGNKFTATSLDGMKALIIEAGYVEAPKWKYSSDAWGGAIQYHAAPDGQSYILVSPGADGRWDVELRTYFDNTDAGMEAYEGPSADANRDFIWATGSFVQFYRAD